MCHVVEELIASHRAQTNALKLKDVEIAGIGSKLLDMQQAFIKAEKKIRAQAEEIERLRAEVKFHVDMICGSSLCPDCAKLRMERRIIATPRIQVEEERDELRAQLADAIGVLEKVDDVLAAAMKEQKT